MEFCSPPSSSSSVASSPRLSGLSTSTSTSLSSAFSGSELSSLPSPSISPAPRESISDFISPGAKTHAFFASPFSTRPPSPLASTINGSTTAIAKPLTPLIVQPQPTPPDTPSPTKKRDFLWLDLNPRSVQDLSSAPTPVSAHYPDPDETTPKLPAVTPTNVHEELAVGSIIRARVPPRSRSVSTDNSGVLTSCSVSSESPLSQSPISQISGLPEATTSYSVTFPGLPPESPNTGATMLTVEAPPSSGTTLRLTAPLGAGAFSSVWLAEDLSDDPLVLRSRRSLRNLRREGSAFLSRASSLRKVRVPGVRPLGAGKRMLAEQERTGTSSLQSSSSSSALGSSSSVLGATRLVALKMTARSMYAPCSGREEELQRDRTRVSFVREVEVLRHISHPNITKLLTHLTTPSYHVLVLPYLPGGDLLGLVNSDQAHNALSESLLRRMWNELCKAVGWMHGVGLVHRDVKQADILLTTALPCSTPPSGPLIKLTDFGLSRFIDMDAPLLSTRCGSEAYAAPELVISGRRYDARETDAWACGVVLYALCARRLPFGEGVASPGIGGRIGREGGTRESAGARRRWLMCIARGEYEWPARAAAPMGDGEDVSESESEGLLQSSQSGDSELTVSPDKDGDKQEAEELMGPRLVESAGARGVVARLLVRDPSRRAKIIDLWDDQWMGGASAGISSAASSARLLSADVETQSPTADSDSDQYRGEDEDVELDGEVEGFEDEDLEEDDDVDDDGLLLDQDGIDSIARQEVH
ncbi:kinase-like domain-containing protein [Mycena galericulata]|nr:kinase-like domain-containing protein [Mycena galericulata]